MVVAAARRSVEMEADPKAVYVRVCERLMEFTESLIEQQTRADRQFEACLKGRLSAVQFLPVWEKAVTELELKGLGRSERELLLAYLKRCGPAARTEVLKDRRAYPRVGGGEEVRQVKTWREAHRIVVELEQLMEGSRALLAAVNAPEMQEVAAFEGKGRLKGAGKGKAPAGSGKGETRPRDGSGGPPRRRAPDVAMLPEHLKQVCYQMRDQGKRGREGCKFDHDKRRVEEAKKLMGRTGVVRDASRSPGPSSRGSSKGTGRKTEVCQQFLRGSCRYGDTCKFSHSAKVIGRLSKALAAFAGLGAAEEAGASPAAAPQVAAVRGGDERPAVQWTRRAPSGAPVYGPLWEGPGKGEAPDIAATMSGPRDARTLRSLQELPAEAWTRVRKPEPGYNYRTLLYCLGQPHEGAFDHYWQCGLAVGTADGGWQARPPAVPHEGVPAGLCRLGRVHHRPPRAGAVADGIGLSDHARGPRV